MNTFLARLSPTERRFVVGVLAAVFVVLNMVFVWPRFNDWAKVKTRIEGAQQTLALRQSVIGEMKNYEALVRNLELEGEAVPPEDQSIESLRSIRTQAAESSVSIDNLGRQSTRTNLEFFVEQTQPLTLHSGEGQLVDFLYNLGAGKSNIRVRSLSIRPNLPPRQQLDATITLVASYQKKPAARPTAPVAASAAAQTATPNQRRP